MTSIKIGLDLQKCYIFFFKYLAKATFKSKVSQLWIHE